MANFMCMSDTDYDTYLEQLRDEEYPMLKNNLYLDHAGTTLYSKRHMDRFHTDMMSKLLGNPHSASPSSQCSTQMVDSVRLRLLQFFNADPSHFDLIFTANATAAIKLVVDAFREHPGGFEYLYHVDAHTSLVGVREAANAHHCFASDDQVEQWLRQPERCSTSHSVRLLAYPAQSNMNGRRLPLRWGAEVRQRRSHAYTLLDAAAYASTSPLDFTNSASVSDFTALSLYKIFGFPDLGALIVRKEAAHMFSGRKYFGGGTVDMVLCLDEQWHAKKAGKLHEQLEDGTLPIHSILALKSALDTYAELFDTLARVSKHTAALARRLYEGLKSLRHENGIDVCKIYTNPKAVYGEASSQGPILAFNLREGSGAWVSNAEIEKLASVHNIHIRTGSVCNPGGVAQSLQLSPWEMRENFSTGHRCGTENDLVNEKPTGVIRVSLGAMSTRSDVDRFLAFISEYFLNRGRRATILPAEMGASRSLLSKPRLHIESLTVYPVKSCAGWQVPAGIPWEIRREGLAWDREWCIVHQGTGKALSQKQYPRMALIRPTLDFTSGVLRIIAPGTSETITVPLSQDPRCFNPLDLVVKDATVCDDHISTRVYTATIIAEYLTKAVGVPCTLARFPASTSASGSTRHSKAHLHRQRSHDKTKNPILFSNESPILTISRSSLNRLNEDIKLKGGKAAHPSVFRANIVLSEDVLLPPGQEQPWTEDHWQRMQVGGGRGPVLEFLGGCRRCQMVCIDQVSGEKNQEPFATLAKTRRIGGRVLFGVHTTLTAQHHGAATISVGDEVEPFA